MIEGYEEKAQALLDAYRSGTAEALERHYRLTWHRREWHAMRRYVQLDLGRRPAHEGDDVAIDLDDARFLIALEHGFENWAALQAFAATADVPMAAAPLRVFPKADESAPAVLVSRDWNAVLRALAAQPGAVLDAHGQMSDEILAQVASIPSVIGLHLANSAQLTDAGLQALKRLPALRHVNLNQTAVTDAGLAVLRELPNLESLSLVMTAVTDAGIEHLRDCRALKQLNLMWTRTGDGAIRAVRGLPALSHLWSGNQLTNDGLALLHDLPMFARWQGGESDVPLMQYSSEVNQLTLRGRFTDEGMRHLVGLDGLFSLNVDDAALPLSSRAMEPLVSLPHLARLAVDAKDDWMPIIAAMPALRHLGVQDTTAGDDGFEMLSASQSIEQIWGRRCHNLHSRGFVALGRMPRLRGLSVSCLNVTDDAIATLPDFPALRELMPMDIPDAGYRHIGRCVNLESLQLMYCRDTTDAATEQITGLPRLSRYFNSYTTITDRTPALLSGMQSLEEITFDACHGLTNAGIATLARLPRLRVLRVAGNGLTADVRGAFPASVTVHYAP